MVLTMQQGSYSAQDQEASGDHAEAVSTARFSSFHGEPTGMAHTYINPQKKNTSMHQPIHLCHTPTAKDMMELRHEMT